MLRGNRLPGLAIIVGLIAIGALIFATLTQPTCSTVLKNLPAGLYKNVGSDPTDKGTTVTCHADCNLSFSFGPDADQGSEEESQIADANCQSLDERDLVAQAVMGHWSLYSAWLTGIGVLLVIVTYWEARRATATALEIGQMQAAPNIILTNAYIYQNSADLGSDNWALGVHVRNIGHSAVSNFTIWGDATLERSGAVIERALFDEVHASSPPNFIKPSHDKPASFLLISGTHRNPTPEDLAAQKNLVFKGKVHFTYITAFGRKFSEEWRFVAKAGISESSFSATSADPVPSRPKKETT